MTLKQVITKIITYPLIGNLIAWVYQDQIPSSRFKIHTSSQHIAPSIKAALFWHIYESAEIRFVDKYLITDLPVIELGSSLGVISCHILKKLDKDSLLVCVEANPNLIELIKLNLKTNFPDRHVPIINKAIDYSGLSSVSLEIGKINTVSRVVDSIDKNYQNKFQCIATTTLSQIISSYQTPKYTLFSDIEGAEAGFIFKDTNALINCQQLIMEIHNTQLDGEILTIEKMCNRLLELGFHLRDFYGRVYVFEK